MEAGTAIENNGLEQLEYDVKKYSQIHLEWGILFRTYRTLRNIYNRAFYPLTHFLCYKSQNEEYSL